MSTVAEIESAIEALPIDQKREVFVFLSERLEGEGADLPFPDLKSLLSEFPDVGVDADFARSTEFPRDLQLS